MLKYSKINCNNATAAVSLWLQHWSPASTWNTSTLVQRFVEKMIDLTQLSLSVQRNHFLNIKLWRPAVTIQSILHVSTHRPRVHLTLPLILSLPSSTLQGTHMPLLQKKQVCLSRFLMTSTPLHPFLFISIMSGNIQLGSVGTSHHVPLAPRQSRHVGLSEKILSLWEHLWASTLTHSHYSHISQWCSCTC